MKLTDLKKYKKILILGHGKEGQATEKFLKEYLPDAIIGIADQKININYLDEQKNYDLIIRSPGISKKLITRSYTTATNIFFANINNVIIGVTGTKGKSTTASLIYSILKTTGKKVHLVGNIGLPMLEEMLKPIGKEDIFVIELSSYQLDDIKYSPHVAVVLDLFPEHMNYHGNIENYYQAKKNIIKYLTAKDYFVYNPRFPNLCNWAKDTKAKAIPYEPNLLLQDKDIPLLGEHNRENIKAALTVAHIFNINNEIIIKAIKNFKPLPHRLELVGNFKGISFYDDAISTTPESTIYAIESLKNIGTIFLGGEDRGYDFSQLVKSLKDHQIANLVLFPESGEKILSLLNKENNYFPKIFSAKNMEEAVKFAYGNTKTGSICILSCASPSYSLWKNFEEKGNEFQKCVKKYV